MAGLYADLSAAERRLSTVVTEYPSTPADEAIARTAARGRLASAVLADGYSALDRVAELPALVRHAASQQRSLTGSDLIAQADTRYTNR